MHAIEFFGRPEIQLPMRRTVEDYRLFTEATLKSYINLIQLIDQDDEISQAVIDSKSAILELCENIKTLINVYHEGFPHKAYEKFSQAIRPWRDHLELLSWEEIRSGKPHRMYRIRTQLSPPFTREEMFHIPFELRSRVGSQRYSIPGLPCLYLGGSVYDCWCELGQPSLVKCQAAAFWMRGSSTVKLLDFGHKPSWLNIWINGAGHAILGKDAMNYIFSHVVLWPIMALCSTKTLHRDRTFKPEYILPQILLQWLTNETDFDGIRYFSTHVSYTSSNPHPISNYVFPVKTHNERGRCSILRSKFKMTEPMNWQLLRGINLGDDMAGHDVDMFDMEFFKGVPESYHKTEFGMIQQKLNKMVSLICARNLAGEPELGDLAP